MGVSLEWREVSFDWVSSALRLIIRGSEGCAWEEAIFVVIVVLYSVLMAVDDDGGFTSIIVIVKVIDSIAYCMSQVIN